MPQLSAPPYWHLPQKVPSLIPSSQTCFPQRAKGLKPLLWKPSSLGVPLFPLPGELPLLPKVRVLDPMKSTQMMGPASSSGLVVNMLDNTSLYHRPLSPLSPPLTPPATPPTLVSSESLLATPTKTSTQTYLESSSMLTLSQSPSPPNSTKRGSCLPTPALPFDYVCYIFLPLRPTTRRYIGLPSFFSPPSTHKGPCTFTIQSY